MKTPTAFKKKKTMSAVERLYFRLCRWISKHLTTNQMAVSSCVLWFIAGAEIASSLITVLVHMGAL
ncbi:MAG: hypothetical protein K2Q11_11500 [Burkholderiaceae bacterium]|nr:hypothetical protein [Burkholderiaceae bacterium]